MTAELQKAVSVWALAGGGSGDADMVKHRSQENRGKRKKRSCTFRPADPGDQRSPNILPRSGISTAQSARRKQATM